MAAKIKGVGGSPEIVTTFLDAYKAYKENTGR